MVYNWSIGFEFNELKSLSNLSKHGIDFYQAQDLWLSDHLEIFLKTTDEPRWAVIGTIENIFWTAIITKRFDKTRIISVRKSRYEEKESFKKIYSQKD